MKAIFRSELIWINFPAGTSAGFELPFQDQPLLNGVYLMGIEAMNDSTLEVTPEQSAVTADLSQYLLTLNEGSDERHREMPCQLLFPTVNGGVWKETIPFIVDWQKSRVRFMGATPLAELEAVPFLAHYFRPEDMPRYKTLCAELGVEP